MKTTSNYLTAYLNIDTFLQGLLIKSPDTILTSEQKKKIETSTNKQIHNILHKLNIELKADTIQEHREGAISTKLNLNNISIKVYSIKRNDGFHWNKNGKYYKNIKVVGTTDGSTCWEESSRSGIVDICKHHNFFGVLLFDKVTNELIARCWLKWINKKSFVIFNVYSSFNCRLKLIADAFNLNNKLIELVNSQDNERYLHINNNQAVIINGANFGSRFDLCFDVNEYKEEETFEDCHGNEIGISQQEDYTYSDYLDRYILNDDLIIAYNRRGNEVYLCSCCDNDITKCNHCDEYNLND